MRALIVMCLTVAWGLGGCASTPQAGPPPPDRTPFVRSIELCRTTESQLRIALGAPTRDGVLHNARVMSWILGRDDGVIRYLAVLLDADGIVVDRIWNLPTEIPWTPTDRCHPAMQPSR